ncbi:MAG: hypothetical protein QW474_03450 [Candidatus Aenigmatarchaeota archaeon]
MIKIYELAGEAKPVLEAIYNLREKIRLLNEEGKVYWQNLKYDLDNLYHLITNFLGKNKDFLYRDRVREIIDELKEQLYNADPTSKRVMGHQPRNVRSSRLPHDTYVYFLLNELSDLFREGYHKKSSHEAALLILSSVMLSFFVFYNFNQTAQVSAPGFSSASIAASLFLFLVSLFLLLKSKIFKKH